MNDKKFDKEAQKYIKQQVEKELDKQRREEIYRQQRAEYSKMTPEEKAEYDRAQKKFLKILLLVLVIGLGSIFVIGLIAYGIFHLYSLTVI